MNVINKKFVGIFVAVIMLLSFAATAQPLTAQNSYTNVTPKQANQMIKSYPSNNIVILDVRNESECRFDHLYNSLNLPVFLLEPALDYYLALPDAEVVDYRSVILMEHINDPIVVYCGKGSRGEEAANILVERGFTQVYNIIGGIEAWIQADLPFYNTAHNITVSQTKTIVDPLTSFPCDCENQQDDPNENGLIQNRNVNMIEETEDYVHGTFSFECDGAEFDTEFSTTILWTYEDSDRYSNVTAKFELMESTGDIVRSDYLLAYQVQHVDYNFTVMTMLQLLDADTYNASETVVRFMPTGKADFLSLEKVTFTTPVTLTKLYAGLEKICKDLSQTYKKDGSKNNDDVLTDLAVNYGHMADGLKDLSKLVHKELRSYDLEILQSQVLLLDDYCLLCEIVVGILVTVVTCGPLDVGLVALICVAANIPDAETLAPICALIVSAAVGVICGTLVGSPTAWGICDNMNYCGIYYVDSLWSAGINNGFVTNEAQAKGEPNGIPAEIWGLAWGDGGNLMCHIDTLSTGGLYVHMTVLEATTVHIYVATNGYNDWRLVSSSFHYVTPYGMYQKVYAYSSGSYNYVAVSGYDSNCYTHIAIDAISANYS
jgi:rhodanese-related sulfurtransferase